MTSVPIAEAKAHLSEIVEEAVRTHRRVTITRHGRPAVVIMSVDDLESLEETLFWQSQPGIHEDIAAATTEEREGTLLDEEAVRERFGLSRRS